MKRFILIFLALTAVLSCKPKTEPVVEEPQEIPEPVYLLPDTERVFLYRDGTTIYEAKIPVEGIIDNSFILPSEVDINSFSIHQDGNRIFSYSLQRDNLLIQLLEKDPNNPEKPLISRSTVLLVNVPEIIQDIPLNVKFGIGNSGVTWKLVLDMEAAQGNTLECNLLASIETGSRLAGNIGFILAKRPEIILLSSSNIFIEGSEAVFNLGNPLIEMNKTTFTKLDGWKSSYRLVYRWSANEQDRPSAYLYCTNPFNASISGVLGNLNSNGLNVNNFTSMRLTPGRQFELPVGSQPLISTFKSANTKEFDAKEFPQRADRPYTHTLVYTAVNGLTERAELEIAVPVEFGTVYRNVYTFQRQPDERPGDRMIWRYNMTPGAEARVEFRYDSENKNNAVYSRFDYYSNGR